LLLSYAISLRIPWEYQQQPPNTYYPPQQQPPTMPPQQPWQQPPPQPPKKKSKVGLIVGIIVAIVVLACIGAFALAPKGSNSGTDTNTTSSSTTATTTTSNQSQGKWTTVQTFTGNGTKKTAVLSVPDDWKIVYSCNGMIAGTATDGILGVNVYNSDGSIADLAAVNATCKSGSKLTTGETEEHQSGNIYLDINGTGEWKIQIQELK